MTTKVINFSESAIKKVQVESQCSELRDPRFPLRFRFHANRLSGSWFFVKNAEGKSHWRKLGVWPHLKAKDVIANLSEYESRLAVNLHDEVLNQQFKTVLDLLEWYAERSSKDNTVTSSRRATIKWAIQRQLIPMLGECELIELTHSQLDEKLFWPLQRYYSIATVRSVWSVFKQAFKRAHKLKLIGINPVAGYLFNDFIEMKVAPKPAQLKPEQVESVIKSIENVAKPTQMLVMMMLLHGTRIGETRCTKWAHICFDSGRWNIPEAITKTKQAHTIPLTETAMNLLKWYRAWQRSQGYKGAFLFPNKPIQNCISRNKANELIKTVSNGLWCSHSLRKLARTAWMDLDVDYMTAELLLNHAMNKLDQTYIHTYAERQKSQALQIYHQWLEGKSPEFFNLFNDHDDLKIIDIAQTA
ncbi:MULTISPECIES: tyrosine-type recombinase/integrase [Vibrio]|uniref:tyrosine-type recombinase/integrase n=1 Tax=Vibrio TaxID=662 RepID=UPI0015948C34|nr:MULTISPECIES: tyrosine-type recombinase/integrase [Vibrio]NGZ18662.1 tyrosine-type recombinase/integrase [Vibrio aestuarianus]